MLLVVTITYLSIYEIDHFADARTQSETVNPLEMYYIS
jgi:hypothetical protein